MNLKWTETKFWSGSLFVLKFLHNFIITHHLFRYMLVYVITASTSTKKYLIFWN